MREYRPQRWYPRYAPLLERAGRIPGGLGAATAILRPFGEHREFSAGERPTLERLPRIRFVIAAFPRTGSTYLQSVLVASCGDADAVWKGHNVFKVPQYLDRGVDVLVPLREPVATALSWSTYNHDGSRPDLLRMRFDAYTTWFREVRRWSGHPRLHLLPFEEFTQDPGRAAHELGLGQHTPVSTDDIVSTLQRLEDQEAIDPEMQHLPSTSRAEQREQRLRLLDDPAVRRARARADAVFADLTDAVGRTERISPWQSIRRQATGASGLAMGVSSATAAAVLITRGF